MGDGKGKKIIIWGTGAVLAMYHRFLMERFEVCAFISEAMNPEYLPEEVQLGAPLISAEQLKDYERDAIVTALREVDREAVEKAALSIGIGREELIPIEEFLISEKLAEEYEEASFSVQSMVLKEIATASDEEISDYDWMYRRVISYGIFCFKRNWFQEDSRIRWDKNGIQQVPEEFTEFCVFLSPLRLETALELGVFRGRSSYFMCAVLMRKNPGLSYLMADIEDRLDRFDGFFSLLPALKKRIPSTSEDFSGKQFDYVFIDADHSYDASIRDYENVGQFAGSLLAFHDVYGHEYDSENGGTVRTWKEVMERTKRKAHRVFSKYPDQWMGIGCVLTGGNDENRDHVS